MQRQTPDFIRMPCLWGRHNNSQIFVSLLVLDATSVATNPTNPLAGIAPSNPPVFTALVDSGAQRTMISPAVVARLGLNPIGKIPVRSAGGTIVHHDGYLFNIAFVVPNQPVGGSTSGSVLYTLGKPIWGPEIPATGGSFDVLMGMDVISSGSLKIEGDGTFSWSW
jgi:hypothetical protein